MLGTGLFNMDARPRSVRLSVSPNKGAAQMCIRDRSMAAGGALFALAALVPESLQPVFCIIYAFLSVGLLRFAGERGEGNADAPPAGSCKNTWEFTREIEPSLVAFGIVFGLTFVYLSLIHI